MAAKLASRGVNNPIAKEDPIITIRTVLGCFGCNSPSRSPLLLNLYSAAELLSAERSEHTLFGFVGAVPDGSPVTKQLARPDWKTGNRDRARTSIESTITTIVSRLSAGRRIQSRRGNCHPRCDSLLFTTDRLKRPISPWPGESLERRLASAPPPARRSLRAIPTRSAQSPLQRSW
jgi:hypothetical protein